MRKLLEDKRGILGFLTLPVVIVLAILVLLLVGVILVFASVNKFIVVGAGMIALFLIFGLRGDFNKTKAWFGVFIIGAGLIFIFASGTLQEVAGGTKYIEVPAFGYVECAPASGGTVDSGAIKVSGDFVECPENSVSCDISFSHPDLGVFDLVRRIEYYVCDDTNFNNCESPQYVNNIEDYSGGAKKKIYSNLPSNKAIYIEFQQKQFPKIGYFKESNSEGRIYVNYQPFILWVDDTLGGGRNPFTSNERGCRLGTESFVKNAITSSSLPLNEGSYKFQDKLEPYETYNYISGTITSARDGNVINYKGKEGYCIDAVQGTGKAVIYSIDSIKTISNNYEVVNTNEPIGEVDCCRDGLIIGNQICNDFEWEQIKVDKETGKVENEVDECGVFNPCPTGRRILGEGTKSFQYKCVEGSCVVQDIRKEDCVSNSDCKINEICKNFECIIAGDVTVGGEKVTGESLECAWYQEEKTQSEVIRSWYNYLGIGEPTIVTNKVCTTASWVYFAGIGVIVLFLGTLAILTMKPKKKRRKRK